MRTQPQQQVALGLLKWCSTPTTSSPNKCCALVSVSPYLFQIIVVLPNADVRVRNFSPAEIENSAPHIHFSLFRCSSTSVSIAENYTQSS
eukprot:gene6207-7421_t